MSDDPTEELEAEEGKKSSKRPAGWPRMDQPEQVKAWIAARLILKPTERAWVGICARCFCEFMVNRLIEKVECVRCGHLSVFPKTSIDQKDEHESHVGDDTGTG